MFRTSILAGALCTVFLAASTQAEEDVPALDPEAVDLLTNAASFLAEQQKLSFNWFVSFDVVVDGREKITYLRSGYNILSRGEGFYSFSESGDGVREYFYDTAAVAIADPGKNAYVSAPFDGTFEELVARLRVEYGVILPIWEMLSKTSSDDLLRETEAAAYLGTTLFAGREAHHLAFADYDQDWQVWISTDEDKPLPLMIVGTNPYEQGWPQYRAYFTDWNLEPEIVEGQFTLVPDEDDIRVSWPKVVAAVEAGREGLLIGSKARTGPAATGDAE